MGSVHSTQALTNRRTPFSLLAPGPRRNIGPQPSAYTREPPSETPIDGVSHEEIPNLRISGYKVTNRHSWAFTFAICHIMGGEHNASTFGECDIKGATVRASNLIGCTVSEEATLVGCNLTNCDVVGRVALQGCNLVDCNVRSATLYGCSLIKGSNTRCVMIGCTVVDWKQPDKLGGGWKD